MQTAVLTPVDVSAIKDTAKPWVEACLARDWDALLGLCTDDVVFLPPDEPIVTANHVRPWLDNYPHITRFDVEFDHVEGQDQLAIGYGHFTMTLELPGSAAPTVVDGKFVDTFKKDLQGSWKYSSVTWNSNVPSALRPGTSAAPAAPLKATSFMSALTVDDLARSITFFEGLGLVVTDRWEEQGRLLGVVMAAGPVQIGLSQDDGSRGRDRKKGIGCSTWIEANQSIDEVAARAKAAGIKIDKGPYDTPWGNRAFDVTSAEGFALTIATPMKPQS